MEELQIMIHMQIKAGESPTGVKQRFKVVWKTVYNAKKLFTKLVVSLITHSCPGRSKTTRTETTIDAVMAKIDENLCCDMCQIAGTWRSINWTFRGLQGRICTWNQELWLLCKDWLLFSERKKPGRCKISDEKVFTVHSVSNSRTTRYISKSPVDIYSKYHAWAMILGIVESDGKAFLSVWVKATMEP